MNNTDLQRFECEGIELIINTKTGESFATVSGYARMTCRIYGIEPRQCACHEELLYPVAILKDVMVE